MRGDPVPAVPALLAEAQATGVAGFGPALGAQQGGEAGGVVQAAADGGLSLGGTQNLEHWQFSRTVRALMRDLGVEYRTLRRRMEFDYGESARNGPAIWFDKETYGVDRLVTGYNLEWWETGGHPSPASTIFP